MPNRCSVPECKGSGGFKFPTDPDLCIKWRVAIKRLGPDKSLWKPGIHAVVCDKHFKAEDFKEPLHKSIGRTKRTLEDGAIPSVFPFSNADKTAEEMTHSIVNKGQPVRDTFGMSHRGRRCAVPDCTHYKRFAPGSGFQFPLDPEVRQKWIEAVRRYISLQLEYDGTEWEPQGSVTNPAKVCAAHFRKDDFMVRNSTRHI